MSLTLRNLILQLFNRDILTPVNGAGEGFEQNTFGLNIVDNLSAEIHFGGTSITGIHAAVGCMNLLDGMVNMAAFKMKLYSVSWFRLLRIESIWRWTLSS